MTISRDAELLDGFTERSIFGEPWPDGCWVWQGAVNEGGYGRVMVHDGERYLCRRVHRLAYEAMVGAIPEGLDLDHLCRNRACWNPAHLEPVTRRENTLRGLSRSGPSPEARQRGIANSAAKQRAKTHCPQGHEYTPDNTDTYNGSRRCRECNRNAAREYQWRVSNGSQR